MSMPNSVHAARPLASRRCLNAGSVQACAMTRGPRYGKSSSNFSMRARICSAVMTPFSTMSSCMARLMISHSDGGPWSWERSWLCGWSWLAIAVAHLRHLGFQLGLRDEPAFEQHHAHRVRRALEVTELQIALAEILGRAPQLIQPHHLAARQRVAQRVRLLLPELHAVIDGVDRAAGLAAHVVRALVV